MSVIGKCSCCGAALSTSSLGQRCPKCLLKFALDPAAAEAGVPQDGASGAAQLPIGKIHYFGDYQLLEEIARGGMGVVWKARQVSLNRIIAVKLLLAGKFSSPEFVKRFQAEAESAARLQHPNIVAIHEVGEHESQPYFSMDYVEGQDLARLVGNQPLPARRAGLYLRIIAEAVHHAHERGVLHRDLKPSNILIDAHDQPRVTDFGLAKRLPAKSETQTPDFEEADLTITGQVLGTPSYMPPEQAAGRRSEISIASDVYSLGAILFYMLTGRPPFQGESFEATLRQVCDAEPVSPRLLNAGLPRDLETICLKCLSKTPGRRYESAKALADDLQCWLNGQPIRARPVSSPEKLWRWCRRKPALATALASVAVLLLAVAVISTVSAAKLKQADRIRTEELYRSYLEQIRAKRLSDLAGHRAAGLALVAKAVAIRPSLDLRNEAIATLATMDVEPGRTWNLTNIDEWIPYYFDGELERYASPAGANDIRICRASDDIEVARLHHPGRSLRLIFGFSPNGRYLAANYHEQQHWTVWDVANRRIVLDDPQCQHAITFSRDGGRMAASQPDGRIVLYQLSTGAEVASVQAGRPLSWLSLNASGDRVLGCNPGAREIGVWTFATTDARSLVAADVVVNADWDGDDLIAAGSATGRIHVWDASSGQLVQTIAAHGAYVQQVLFNHRGDLLASTSWDGTTRFCNPWTGQIYLTFPRNAQALQFSLNDRRFSLIKLALGPKSRFAFLDMEESPVLQRIEHFGHLKNAWSLCFSPNARWLAVADGEDGGVRLYDVASRRLLADLPDYTGRMVLFEPGGKSLLTGGAEGLSRWPVAESGDHSTNTVQFGPRQPISPLKNIVFGALTPDGRWLACSQERETNQVWLVDLADADHPIALGRHDAIVNIGISPDGQWITSGNWGRMEGVKIWNTRSRTLEKSLPMGGVLMAWSPDSRWFAASATLTNFTQEQQIWDSHSWTMRHSFVPEQSHGPMAFSPDSRIIAFVTDQHLIRLHEVTTFCHLATLESPSRSQIAWLQFSPDGQRLAVLELNHGVQLWDLAALQRELKARALDWESPP